MIKRSHIRKFLAVVDAGSFTQAAQRIRMTQPTLSAGIADLEQLVDAALFIRDRRQVRLTEAGGRFLPIARELERHFRSADSFARSAEPDWPDLKLGAIRTISGAMMRMVVEALSPIARLELMEGSDGELRAALASGRMQAVLTLVRPGDDRQQMIPLWSEPYVMLVGAGHPLAGREEVHPEELGAEIMIARRSCEMLDATSRFFTSYGVRPRFSLRSDSDERCLHMVAAGLGITTAPASLAIEGTVSLCITGYDFDRKIGLLLDPSLAGAAAVADALKAAAAGLAAAQELPSLVTLA